MLNKSMIDKMLEMPDDKMLMMLKILLSSTGIEIPSKKLDERTLHKIRALLEEVTDNDIGRIMYLSNVYKNGGENGKR